MVNDGVIRMRIVTRGTEETLDVGARLGEELLPGDLVALVGELGTGKTCLTKGIARGLQVPEGSYVRSPSFVIMNVYPGRCPLYHLDLHRIQSVSELEDLGTREFFYGEGVTVVEWADKIHDWLPPEHVRVHLCTLDESRREFLVEVRGQRFEKQCTIWKDTLSRFAVSGASKYGHA